MNKIMVTNKQHSPGIHWTDAAKECYERKSICKGCRFNGAFESFTCQMSKHIPMILLELGTPEEERKRRQHNLTIKRNRKEGSKTQKLIDFLLNRENATSSEIAKLLEIIMPHVSTYVRYVENRGYEINRTYKIVNRRTVVAYSLKIKEFNEYPSVNTQEYKDYLRGLYNMHDSD